MHTLRGFFGFLLFMVCLPVVSVWAAEPQTITFPALPNKLTTDAPFTLSATAGSGLAVNYQVVSSGGVATVSGNTVTLTGIEGSVTITATQPGDGTYAAAAPVYRTFVVFAPGARFVKMARGLNANHAAGIRADGTLWTWGANGYGQLGDGTTAANRNYPAQVGTAANWESAAVGYEHTLATRADGTLWAWGDNTLGQLGDGTGAQSASPVQVGPDTNWQSVAAGGIYSLAIRTDGTLWGWGSNLNHMLVPDLETEIFTPVKLSPATNWQSVSAGNNHIVAVRTDGTLWAWGSNVRGQLGDGTLNSRNSPAQVDTGTDWRVAAAGLEHTVAIRTNGTLWAWGSNLYGQLGLGAPSVRRSPVQVGTATNWQSVAAGLNHTVAVRTDGTLWEWGQRPVDGGFVRTPLQVGTATSWQAVTAGSVHSAAIRMDGTLWAWGANFDGQLTGGQRLSFLPVLAAPGRGTQTVTIPPFGASPGTGVALAATASSGLPVSYAVSGPATLDGSVLTITDPGEVLLDAWQAGDAEAWRESPTVRVVVAPDMKVEQPAGTVLTDGATIIAFEKVDPGSASAAKTFTITSTGFLHLSDLTVGVISPTPRDFTVDTAGMTGTLAPGASATFSVTFTPVAFGPRYATLSIGSNVEGTLNPFTITLTGTGDGTAPETTITAGPAALSNSRTASIAFTGTDNAGVSGFEARLDDAAFAPAGSPVNLTGLGDGAHRFEVRAQDAVGNVDATPASVTWTVDATLPVLPGNITVTATGPDGAVVTYAASDPGGSGLASSSFSPPAGSTFPPGITNVSASATDHAGNTATGSFTVTVIPNQTITFPAIPNKLTTDAPFTLSATAGSGLAVNYQLVSSGGVATVSGNTVTLTGIEGSVTILATQAGDAVYAAAAPVYITFMVLAPASKFVAVARGASASHVAGIRADGTLWAWGNNSSGQLGDGTFTKRDSPVQAGTATNWQSVAVGGGHTVAVRTDGTLWAWGYNYLSEPGDNTSTSRTSPGQVGTATNWQSVAAGSSHTVAIRTDGTLWAWGGNFYGQLGDGSVTTRTSPVQVGNETNWQSVAAGANNTWAVRTDGTLWAWGYNYNGQLGDGTATERLSPVQVGTATNWQSVVGGTSHTLAVRTDGTLWAWGENSTGQLGDGTTEWRKSPVQVGTATNWKSVAAGKFHTVAVRDDGTLWAWGSNDFGQLGDSTATYRLAPLQLGNETNWQDIGAGYDYTVALRTDGTLWTWGHDTLQPGGGLKLISTTPGTASYWRSVAAGAYHTVAVRADGTLWAWGANFYGQLGLGVASRLNVPVQVGTDSNWGSVAAGAYHTVAVRTDGTLWAWGYNYDGQLGDGTKTDRLRPVQIGTDSNWQSVAAGTSHTLAVRSDGTLWAWGDNYFRQLGDGTTTSRTSPVQVGTAAGWRSVSAGGRHSMAILGEGVLSAWGSNSNGQLGLGGTSQRNWKSAAAGASHSLAVQTNGTLWASGFNGDGQLGDGTETDRLSPVQIGKDSNWQSVAAGAGHSLAARTDGTLWAWGDNSSRQLGDGTTTDRTSPQQVGAARGWSLAICGADRSLAIRGGRLWAIGSNLDSLAAGSAAHLVPRPIVPFHAPQTVFIPPFTATPGVPVTLTATSNSGLPVSYGVIGPATLNGNILTITGPGEVILDAWQLGDTNAWQPSPLVSHVVNADIRVEQPPGTVLADTGTISFGDVLYGSSSEKTFTITNSGHMELAYIAVTMDGYNPGDFSLQTSGMAGALAPGMSTTFSIRFTPADSGGRRAAIHISSNAGGALNPFDIAITGTGLDTTPPETIITSGPPAFTNSSSASISFTGTDDVRLAGFYGMLDEGLFNWVAGPVNLVRLPDGTHTYQVWAVDAGGNLDRTPASVTWTVDTKPPTLPGNMATIDDGSGGAMVSFAASDTGGTGIAVSSFTPASGSTFPIGTTTVNASATDRAGNTTTGSFTVAVAPLTQSNIEARGGGAIAVPVSGGNGVPYPSALTVTGLSGTIGALRVKLNGVSHSNPDDLDIYLVAPSGKAVALLSDAGGTTDLVAADLLFDDAAAGLAPDSAAITAGSYRPTNYETFESVPPGATGPFLTTLGALAGTRPNGDWKLYITDDRNGDAGGVNSWDLVFDLLPPAIAVWRQAYFGTAANSGDAADDADPDGDGLGNFLEWACGLDPTAGSPFPATMAKNGNVLEYTYVRSRSAVDAGAVFVVEWSDALSGGSWNAAGVTQQMLTGNGTEQQIKASIPVGGGENRFVHLRVTAPP